MAEFTYTLTVFYWGPYRYLVMMSLEFVLAHTFYNYILLGLNTLYIRPVWVVSQNLLVP